MKKHNKVVIVICIALMEALTTIYGCATAERSYHRYIMRGQILDASGKDVYLCIGHRDGAKVGQQLEVVRHVPVVASNAGKRFTRASFRRETTGAVRIMEIVDEHYAKAIVISGKAEKHAVVELDSDVK